MSEETNETKICPSCRKEVLLESTKCPYCRSRIRRLEVSNYPANWFIILTIFTSLISLAGKEAQVISYLSLAGAIGLIAWDWHNLSKNKLDGTWCLWGIFCYPIYLWIRDAKTGNGWARSIFWIVWIVFLFIYTICVVAYLANGGTF